MHCEKFVKFTQYAETALECINQHIHEHVAATAARARVTVTESGATSTHAHARLFGVLLNFWRDHSTELDAIWRRCGSQHAYEYN